VAVIDEHELYGVARDRFVAERTALVRALRAEGRREDSQRVAKLAKPPLPAWTVNQLARREPRAFAELFAAGERLSGAQRELISGNGDADALRQAGQRERAVVDDLVTAARGVLSAAGDPATTATLSRVAETLHAAALEPEVQEVVTAGCLDRELRHVGLGPEQGDPTPPVARSGTTQAAAGPSAGSTKDDRATHQRQRRSEQADAGRERERLKVVRRAEADARRQAERAAHQLERAVDRRDRAARALDDAEHVLRAAQERADATAERAQVR
jgi:hypothetical protein